MADEVEVRAEGDAGDGPSSHETCGQFPSQEVRSTFPGSSPDPQSETPAARRRRRRRRDQCRTRRSRPSSRRCARVDPPYASAEDLAGALRISVTPKISALSPRVSTPRPTRSTTGRDGTSIRPSLRTTPSRTSSASPARSSTTRRPTRRSARSDSTTRRPRYARRYVRSSRSDPDPARPDVRYRVVGALVDLRGASPPRWKVSTRTGRSRPARRRDHAARVRARVGVPDGDPSDVVRVRDARSTSSRSVARINPEPGIETLETMIEAAVDRLDASRRPSSRSPDPDRSTLAA